MKNDRLTEALLSLVGELHPDDGINPTRLDKAEKRGKRIKPRKAAALCKQLESAIDSSLPAKLGVGLVSVGQGPDVSSVVALFQRKQDCRLSTFELQASLLALVPLFREEAATEMPRKRIPNIIVQVSPEIAP